MSPLREALGDYLTIRRSLGYQLYSHELLLDDFLAFLERAGADTGHDRAGGRLGTAAAGRQTDLVGSPAGSGPRVRPPSGDDRPADRGSAQGSAARPRAAAGAAISTRRPKSGR